MEPNETLQDVAPDEGQPTDEAVAPDLSAQPSTETDAAAPDEGQPAPRLWAGKYKSEDELERAHLDQQREASRMAGELAAYKRTSQPQPTASDPIASTIEKHEAERGKWEQYAAREDLSWQDRAKALSQISRYDREIGKLEAKREYGQESSRSTASQSLETDALAVFETYQQDLSPGSPLYAAAEQRYADMLRAGYPEGTASKANAVLWAAHKTGANKTRVIQADRKGLLENLQKSARTAQKAGAGSATPVKTGGVTAQQLKTMSDADFAKWDRENVLGA